MDENSGFVLESENMHIRHITNDDDNITISSSDDEKSPQEAPSSDSEGSVEEVPSPLELLQQTLQKLQQENEELTASKAAEELNISASMALLKVRTGEVLALSAKLRKISEKVVGEGKLSNQENNNRTDPQDPVPHTLEEEVAKVEQRKESVRQLETRLKELRKQLVAESRIISEKEKGLADIQERAQNVVEETDVVSENIQVVKDEIEGLRKLHDGLYTAAVKINKNMPPKKELQDSIMLRMESRLETKSEMSGVNENDRTDFKSTQGNIEEYMNSLSVTEPRIKTGDFATVKSADFLYFQSKKRSSAASDDIVLTGAPGDMATGGQGGTPMSKLKKFFSNTKVEYDEKKALTNFVDLYGKCVEMDLTLHKLLLEERRREEEYLTEELSALDFKILGVEKKVKTKNQPRRMMSNRDYSDQKTNQAAKQIAKLRNPKKAKFNSKSLFFDSKFSKRDLGN